MRHLRPQLLLAMVIASCSNKEVRLPELTVTPIDPEGGIARSADGLLAVQVTPGALASRIDVTILTDRTSRNTDLVRPIYELGPSGLRLDPPAEVSLAVGGLKDVALVNVDGLTPVPVEGYVWNEAQGVLHARLGHFSRYSAMRVGRDAGPRDNGAGPCMPPPGRPPLSNCPCGTDQCCLNGFCYSTLPGPDGGPDAGRDAEPDAAPDAGSDPAPDAGRDARPDTGPDWPDTGTGPCMPFPGDPAGMNCSTPTQCGSDYCCFRGFCYPTQRRDAGPDVGPRG